jgi:L-fuconolactonase
MTVIDAHHHVWDLTVRDQDWITGDRMAPIRRTFTLDDLRPSARAAGVGATVLVQTVTVAEETPEMLALAAADPLVAGVVGWTDLTSPAIAGELARLTGGPGGGYLVSIRHQVQSEPDPDWLRRPDVIRGLRAVAAAGLCYDLVVLPHQIPAASYAAAAVPDLTLVLDHAGKPPIANGDLGAWAAAVREFAALPNTTCKLSGLVTEAPLGAQSRVFAPVADVVLSAFGAERIMFGSDWPVCLLASDYVGVTALARSLVAGLSDAERAAVFGATAARVYRIGTRVGAGPWR